MKPNRPDSAKSAKTRITLDSDYSSNNLTQSKFSQTYSNGVRANNNNDFHKYVAEKNKDPKFKKFLETNMPEIPQQTKPSSQLSKLTSKPFERKTSKNQKLEKVEKAQKKIEEPSKKIEEEAKQSKKEILQSSKTFIDKSKQKLKVPSKQEIDEKSQQGKISEPNKNAEQDNKLKANGGNKPKINLNGFVLNVPGKPPKLINEEKKEEKVEEIIEEMKERKQRQKLMTELSEYVKEIQEKNVDYLPKRYDEFIERNLSSRDFDLEKIKIDEFLEEPTERDYENLMKKINENEHQLESKQKDFANSKISQSNSSINLQQIIDGTGIEKQEADNASVIMSSMSASDVRDRNMFITQILKGRRVTEEQINQIKENNSTMVKLIKLEGVNKQDELDDDEVEVVEVNMNKKKNGKFIERNKFEAAGELYRQCDYLTAEQQKRIDDLINGVPIQSPFEMTEMESFMNRRIDEGIKLHRQLCQSIEGASAADQQIVIAEQTLPKDPLLRKNAQMKILKQKINSVNARLGNLNQVVINKTKIQNLVSKYKQAVKVSKASQNLIDEKKKQIENQCDQLKQAQKILIRAENSQQQMLALIDELSQKFRTMEADVAKLQKMDVEQLRKMEQRQLDNKKKYIEQLEKEAKEFENEIQTLASSIGEQLKRKMEILDQIMTVNNEDLKCEGYSQGQTIEDLDVLVTKKWQAAEQALRDIRQHTA